MGNEQTKIKDLYVTLAIIAVIGVVILVIVSQTQMIAGFLLGIAVTAGVIWTVITTMRQLYGAQGQQNATVKFISGPMPKLLLMLSGVFLSRMLPNIFNMLGYVLGLGMYALVFMIVAVLEFFRTRIKPSKE